jgi:hypothetical protein
LAHAEGLGGALERTSKGTPIMTTTAKTRTDVARDMLMAAARVATTEHTYGDYVRPDDPSLVNLENAAIMFALAKGADEKAREAAKTDAAEEKAKKPRKPRAPKAQDGAAPPSPLFNEHNLVPNRAGNGTMPLEGAE